jgi:hypothetical protein
MKDNVSENQARDYLVEKYPDHLELDVGGGDPRVRPRPTADTAAMPSFFADMGLPDPGASGMDEETAERDLVPAARRRLAMDRQQMLATMVMMGINRIIVTDGSIKASVVFDLSTRDAVQRARSMSQTATFGEHTHSNRRPGFFGWFSGYQSNASRTTDFRVQTVTADKDDSQAQVDMKAKLAGEVNVRFKSETFPLERMADLLAPAQLEQLKEKLPATAAIPAAPPLPPLPTLPTPGAAPGGRVA